MVAPQSFLQIDHIRATLHIILHRMIYAEYRQRGDMTCEILPV